MNYIKILTFFLFLFLRNSFAQSLPPDLENKYKILNNANWYYYKGNYKLAYENFRKIENDNRINYMSIFKHILCCLKLGYIDEAKILIEYYISNFGAQFETFYYNNAIDKNDKRFTDIKSNEKKLLGNFYTIEKIGDIKLLEHYFRTDLFMNNDLKQLDIKLKCEEYQTLMEEIKYIHDLKYTSVFLKELIKKYNFPNAYDIGDHYDDYFYFLLRHNHIDSSIYNNALYNGKISPHEYASIMDYHYNFDNKSFKPKQNYGPNLKKVNNSFMMGYIDDIDNVDLRREKIGLPPLWQVSKLGSQPFQLSQEYINSLKNKGIKFE